MRRILLTLTLCLFSTSVQGSPLEQELPGAAMRGESVFRYIGIPIYTARLYTISGAALRWEDDFALELTYLRRVGQADLIDSTLQEFTRAGPALPLRTELRGCFVDVARGDRYLAVSDGPDAVNFWHNGRQVCALRYPDIKARFMGIFLGDKTRSRAFTQRLLGNR